MSKINRKQRKQLARDIAKITGKKITFTLRAFVTPMVQDRKPAMFKSDSLDKLTETSFGIILKLAENNKKRTNPVYFEPVVFGR